MKKCIHTKLLFLVVLAFLLFYFFFFDDAFCQSISIKIGITVFSKALSYFFKIFGWEGGLLLSILLRLFVTFYNPELPIAMMMDDPAGAPASPLPPISYEGDSWIDEYYPSPNGEEVDQPNPISAPVASPGAAIAQEEQAPAEVAHPAPNLVEEIAALKSYIHALIAERVGENANKRFGFRYKRSPDQIKLNSDTANDLMKQLEVPENKDVEKDAEECAEYLRNMAEKIREDKNLLTKLIKDYIPKK